MDGEAIQRIIETAQLSATPAGISDDGDGSGLEKGTRALILLNGDGSQRLESVKPIIDQFRERPERMKGVATVQTIDSFNDLVNRHKDEAATIIFADTLSASPGLTAVLNYNTTDQKPGWRDHRVSFKFPLSKEWRLWVNAAAEGKRFSQPEFGAFLLFNMIHLAAPTPEEEALAREFNTTCATPADLLQLGKGLELHINATSKEEVNPRTGEKSIVFVEEQKDANGQKLVVPGMFIIRIPMFQGDGKSMVRIAVHLIFRREGNGRLTWWMMMHMADEALRSAVLAAVERVREATSLPIIEGSPEQ